LPYGSVAYHGAPADLRDVPLGTHLHGQFYVENKDGKQVFGKALRLEDDFSYFARQGRLWRVESLGLDKSTIVLLGLGPGQGQTDAKPTTFRITPATRVWKGRGIGALTDIAISQEVLVNLTVCTLKGPGRLIDIWLDPESRSTATAQQTAIHRQYIHEHGLPAIVTEVDNPRRLVTVTLFDGFDPDLKNAFHVKDHIAASVAWESLRTHDQTNDSSRGPIVEMFEVPAVPGDSGIRIRFQPGELLEGHRPKLYLRIFSGGWPVDDLPREERAYDG